MLPFVRKEFLQLSNFRQDKDAPEYTSTLRSYQRQMATIIEKINDTLEEIKYILHEDD